MAGTITIKYELVAAGQPRPYADTQTVARITWESDSLWWSKPDEGDILNIFEAFGGCTARKETRQGWWESYLDYVKEIDRTDHGATYEVRDVTPFTD